MLRLSIRLRKQRLPKHQPYSSVRGMGERQSACFQKELRAVNLEYSPVALSEVDEVGSAVQKHILANAGELFAQVPTTESTGVRVES